MAVGKGLTGQTPKDKRKSTPHHIHRHSGESRNLRYGHKLEPDFRRGDEW